MTSQLIAQASLMTPLGPLLLAASPKGLGGAWFEEQPNHPGKLACTEAPHHPVLAEACAQLGQYFDGQRTRFDLPLDCGWTGTPFQQLVWAGLLEIPPGHPCTYAQLAAQLERPSASRAVAAALGRNPLVIFLPCHRVIGARGKLTGYSGGLERKRALLELERRAGA